MWLAMRFLSRALLSLRRLFPRKTKSVTNRQCATSATSRPSPEKRRILIVDDDRSLLTVLPETLRLYLGAVDVAVCLSPRIALARVQAEPFDVVLTDVRMPEMNGLELLRHIKEVAPQTSVIMMSGHADESLATVALAAGAVDMLYKPFEPDTLRKTFQRAFEPQEGASSSTVP